MLFLEKMHIFKNMLTHFGCHCNINVYVHVTVTTTSKCYQINFRF